ncbi:MAG: mechanosensitive ion channel family protein, partial [Syntrophobacteraceae bacterium]
APLTGLLFLIALLVWGTRHVKASLESFMKRIRPDGKEIGVRLLISFTSSLIALVHPIACLVWLLVVYSILGLFGAIPALILLYTLAGLLVLALFIRVARDLFCGTTGDTCSVRQIKAEKAKLFCLHLEIFLAYVVLGFVATSILWLDSFPITVKLFINHLYELGVLIWTFALLRPNFLKKFIARPPFPNWEKWLRLLWSALFLLLVAVLFMELLGFQSLSIYTVNATVLTEAIIVAALLLAGTGKGVLKEIFERENVFFKTHRGRRAKLRQFYLPVRLALSAALLAGSLAALLWAWGIGLNSLTRLMGHLSKEVRLGSLHLSPLNVLAASLVLYIIFRGAGLARTILRDRIFPRTGWDQGVQYSIATILQYGIIISGVLLAMNILGFPLASLALLAGAMGIGAGLGLQNVIANFVSGLVLLFERPIKVGDMLVVDGQWGEVKAIKIRSTVFETYDRYVLIIPNSDLLSGKIVNWTHHGIGPNRLTLTVGVGYNSDVTMVTALLLEICNANPRVMKEPPPQVFFKAYGDSSLNFNIWVFVRVPGDRNPATHEINTAIFEAFKEKGIEIPFPQRDLHIIDERKSAVKGEEKEELELPEKTT